MTPPDWNEHCEVTLKVDRFTLGVACLIAAVAMFWWARKCGKEER